MHIHDQAGVSCILSKYLIQRGIDSKVIVSAGQDKFGIKKYYENFITSIDQKDFVKICLKECEKRDVIHVHGREKVILEIRKRYGSSKKIILHYHGTDIRGIKNNIYQHIKNGIRLNFKKLRYNLRTKILLIQNGYFSSLHSTAQQLSNKVLVSTPDLLPLVKNGVYLPNPIDLEHFSKKKYCTSNEKQALIINNEATNTQKSLDYCMKNNIDLKIDVYDRITKPLMYSEMPDFLKRYKIYVDVRFVGNKLLSAMSKTGLESLACGLTVLDYNLNYVTSLPTIHQPNNVIDKLLQIYSISDQ